MSEVSAAPMAAILSGVLDEVAMSDDFQQQGSTTVTLDTGRESLFSLLAVYLFGIAYTDHAHAYNLYLLSVESDFFS